MKQLSLSVSIDLTDAQVVAIAKALNLKNKEARDWWMVDLKRAYRVAGQACIDELVAKGQRMLDLERKVERGDIEIGRATP